MPTVTISIDAEKYDKYQKIENKSGLINDLLENHFKKENIDAQLNARPRSLLELTNDLSQAQQHTEELAKEVIRARMTEEQKQENELRLLRAAETVKLNQASKDLQKALIHLDFIKEHEPDKFAHYAAIYKSKGLYIPTD